MPRSSKKSSKRKQRIAEKPKPYEAIKYELRPFVNPLADLSVAERRDAFRKVGKDAKQNFDRIYPQLLTWFDEFDALYLLSFCSLYFLAELEGIDREARDGKLDFYPNYLEILQAIALTRPRSNSPQPLMHRASELPILMSDVTNSFQLRSHDLPEDLGETEYKKSSFFSFSNRKPPRSATRRFHTSRNDIHGRSFQESIRLLRPITASIQ